MRKVNGVVVGTILGLSWVGAQLWAQDQAYILDHWVEAKVTAYCAGACCCGAHADGRTSIGRDAREPGAAVAPAAIPYRSVVWVEGAGYRLADDTGGAMRRSWREQRLVHIDLRMTSHEEARAWGVRRMRVAIYRPMKAASRPAPSKERASRPIASVEQVRNQPGDSLKNRSLASGSRALAGPSRGTGRVARRASARGPIKGRSQEGGQ